MMHDPYCKEEHWIVEEQQREPSNIVTGPFPQYLLEHENIEEEHELQTLLSKEEETHFKLSTHYLQADVSLSTARYEAVQCILSLNSYHGFSAHTGVLSVNYLDQFLVSFQFRAVNPKKEWMVHLAAIACLSLAAKVEESHVPLLIDLQVENSYVFQPRTIQKMEIMLLSMLDWKMYSATPFSFLNHIISTLHLVNHKRMEFFTLFQVSLLSVIADSRYVQYRPSIIAASITCNVLKRMNFGGDQINYLKNQLCDTLQFSKEKFKGCYQLILTCKSNNGFVANHVSYQTSTLTTARS